jgi:hypothetical protein
MRVIRTRRNPVVPRPQPLLERAPSYRVQTPRMYDERSEARHTERSLQLDSSQYDRITQLVIHQQQPESQQLLPVAALAPARTQRRGWPHTAVKQDCRKVTHTSLVTIRPPASSCQLRSGSHSTTPLNPFDGLGRTNHGLDDIAASCPRSRVATAACPEGEGTSEGLALGRIPSRFKPSCSQQHYHPIPHLQAYS